MANSETGRPPKAEAIARAETREVTAEDGELRLDRWFKRHFPALGHGRLEKLLRTGQVRVDGARVKAGHRLAPGQRIRVPPIGPAPAAAKRRPPPKPLPVSDADAWALRKSVLYMDDDVLAINKPAGLAVQGGTGTRRHLDGMLDALKLGARERPRLVHRLDRDTSGVLVLARNVNAAAWLGREFQGRNVRKLYWALVVGRPPRDEGQVEMALAKRPTRGGGERVAADDDGKPAVTRYKVIEALGPRAAWLALMPLTGRTHQIRAHCAAIGTPIVGDGKFGGARAFMQGEGIGRQMHLHARAIELPMPGGTRRRITAPLPEHMAETWRLFGFDVHAHADDDPFAEAPERRGR